MAQSNYKVLSCSELSLTITCVDQLDLYIRPIKRYKGLVVKHKDCLNIVHYN